LNLNVGNIKGIRVSKGFKATKEGVPPVTNESKPGQVTFAPGEQAYVTLGAGVATQPLNDALAPLNLFTMGAGHGKHGTTSPLDSF
jgi:hypothetical protein